MNDKLPPHRWLFVLTVQAPKNKRNTSEEQWTNSSNKEIKNRTH